MAEAAQRAEEMESAQPTVREEIDLFMAKHVDGKKSAPDIRYRLDRLATLLGGKKIRDVTCQEFIASLETIAEGRTVWADSQAACRRDPRSCQASLALRPTVAALRLLILTGQRATEVTGARWDEFDLL